LDALTRHLMESTFEQPLDQKIAEAAAGSWRSLADLQKLCEERARVAAKKAGIHEQMRASRLQDDPPARKFGESIIEYLDRTCTNTPAPRDKDFGDD